MITIVFIIYLFDSWELVALNIIVHVGVDDKYLFIHLMIRI